MDQQEQGIEVFKFSNEKQCQFHDTVMDAVLRLNDYRYFFYGGAIRGGKTYVCLYIFWQLAKLYPRSRWHIFREDNPALEGTTIPSMEKMIGTKGDDFVWKRGKGNTYILFSNGSKIFFKSENIQGDAELNDLLGLETNGIFLEQMEALTQKLYGRAMERIGSWYIDPMPIPILLGTFNPTMTWVKKELFDKLERGDLKSPYYLMKALPDDNPFVTDEQWKNWKNLDEESYLQMIGGIWRFKTDGNLFAYSFNHDKHVVDITTEAGAKYMEIDDRLPVYLIFDFNVDPMTCLVAQRNGMRWGKIIREYRLRNSDIFELCEQIKNDLGEYYLVVTGDASGRNRNGNTRGKKSYVDNIKSELRLTPRQNQFPSSNPTIANTRIVLNSVLHKHPEFKISSACQFTIDDLESVKTDGQGGIDKSIDKTKTHLLDNVRYFSWNYFKSFVNFNG